MSVQGPQSVAVLCQFLLFRVYSVSSQMRNHRGSPEIINSRQPKPFHAFPIKSKHVCLHTFGYFITVKAEACDLKTWSPKDFRFAGLAGGHYRVCFAPVEGVCIYWSQHCYSTDHLGGHVDELCGAEHWTNAV